MSGFNLTFAPDLRNVEVVIGATQRGGRARRDRLVLEQRHDLRSKHERAAYDWAKTIRLGMCSCSMVSVTSHDGDANFERHTICVQEFRTANDVSQSWLPL